jgi:adenosylmethionine-8-amino-7-oxononanoate aminotransferase
VFGRGAELPRISRGRGCELWDADGRRYLDAAGGAVVVGIGHGVEAVAEAIRAQAAEVAYAHGSMFTSDALETYADELAAVVPVDDARVYPVSGGSEAIETALKMARAYHLARGEDRHVVIGRWGSYHGNTLAALDVGGRGPLRAPYLPWLGRAEHTLAAYEYRCPFTDTHPNGCGRRYAEALERLIVEAGPERVAAFVAEPVAGAALAAAVPPDDYWPAVVEVCRRNGVLLVADEVMTGFGRTGRWFACDHWEVRPDILVAAKGAASGYWPLGLAVASGPVCGTIAARGFTHGFTYSHHLVGAGGGGGRGGGPWRPPPPPPPPPDPPPPPAETRGKRLKTGLQARLDGHPAVGDVRGLGLLIGVELVADRAGRTPFARSERVTERVLAAARQRGLLVYSSTGHAGGDGDLLLLGPPLVITDAEVDEVVGTLGEAIDAVLPGR